MRFRRLTLSCACAAAMAGCSIDQLDDSAPGAGAVYVFTRDDR